MAPTQTARPYAVYDVFTSRPTEGNPVAIVFDADGLPDSRRQRIAAFTNLSETVFVGRPTHPDADYRLHIYTPAYALPFAGHPTLGAANAWLDAGGTPKKHGFVTQECGIGLVSIKITEPPSAQAAGRRRLFFAAPDFINEGDVEPELVQRVCAALRLDPSTDLLGARHIDNGPGWVGFHVRDAHTVLDKVPAPAQLDWATLGDVNIGVVGAYPPSSSPTQAHDGQDAPPAFEVRAICARGGEWFEDPVTGSLNAGIAKWLIQAGKAPSTGYMATQGHHRGRHGRVFVQVDPTQAGGSQGIEGTGTGTGTGTIWVGGDAVKVISGSISV